MLESGHGVFAFLIISLFLRKKWGSKCIRRLLKVKQISVFIPNAFYTTAGWAKYSNAFTTVKCRALSEQVNKAINFIDER